MSNGDRHSRRCAISVDVDSFESILSFHGINRSSYQGYDPVYERAIPRFLRLFDEAGVKATFFIVAKDCLEHKDVIKEIASRGHEIANHSFNHKFGFSMLSREEKRADIMGSTEIVREACGRRPVGFRTPGYDVDEVTIDLLDQAGYIYDSSVYKFLLYPIMRRASYIKAGIIPALRLLNNLPREMLEVVLPPMTAYHPMNGKFWKRGARRILEIPLTMIPFLCLPFNTTFLFTVSPVLFDLGLFAAKRSGIDMNYIFHATDMICGDADKVKIRHPGINAGLSNKQELFARILNKLKGEYGIGTLEAIANAYNQEAF